MILQATQECESTVDIDFERREWEALTYEEKNQVFFLRTKQLLDMFLKRNTISKAQYDKSLADLTLKTIFLRGKFKRLQNWPATIE